MVVQTLKDESKLSWQALFFNYYSTPWERKQHVVMIKKKKF